MRSLAFWPFSASFAQIIVDTPGTGGTDDDFDQAPPCTNCCSFFPVDPVCTTYCGCGTPNICPSFIGLQSSAVQAKNIPEIYRSLAATRDKMDGTKRGGALLSAWETHAEHMVGIFEKEPALAQRVGKALVAYWPTDIWTGSTARVEPDSLKELRTLVRQVAAADAQSESSGLARIIRRQVLPRLDDSLIGRPVGEAFLCFISENGC